MLVNLVNYILCKITGLSKVLVEKFNVIMMLGGGSRSMTLYNCIVSRL